MQAKHIKDVDIQGKNVVIRVDMNVPIKNGQVVSDIRIQRALKTIQYALEQNAAVLVLSHLGRPTEGEYNAEFSLLPVARRLAELLNKEVYLPFLQLCLVNIFLAFGQRTMFTC